MWILIWLSVAPGGVVTSGTMDFPTKEACEAGMKTWGQMYVSKTEENQSIPRLDAKCVDRKTGKP
ncbi:Secreted protein [Methylorubrum extorquens]